MSTAKIVGVYPIPDAEAPCHLVEMSVADGAGIFDIASITQEVDGQPRENWQVPYAERILSADGQKILTEEFEADEQPALWKGDLRLAFFFHHLDPKRELVTPFGSLRLPVPSELPLRLSTIEYEAP